MTITSFIKQSTSSFLLLVSVAGAGATETLTGAGACGCGLKPTTTPIASLHPIVVEHPVALASGECEACEAAPTACGCDSALASDCAAGACEALTSACDAPACTGQCGCECLHCCNQWTVLAGAMFLNRSDAGSFPLIADQNTGATLVDTNDLDFNTAAAPSITLIRELCNCWGWELGYFGTDGWSSSARGGGNVSPVLNGPGVSFPSTAPGTVFQVDSSSELYSAEFNIRRRCNECVTWLAGFRWVEFGDDLNGYAIAPTFLDLMSVSTTNQLYGFQVGADATLFQSAKRVRLDGIVRAGVLGNHIEHTASSPLTGNFGTVSSVNAEDDVTSFLGILGLRGVVPISRCWSAYGGYQVMWLDGVALAADNIQTTSLIAPGSATIDTGTVLFHGATVGLEARF